MELARGYDEATGLCFPLVHNAHDMGWRYLFDLAIVGQALGCRPGDLVLDFAAGPCYVSEFGNRFGYHTVALDIEWALLDIGRQRFACDTRLRPELAAFVAADGQRLPFADQTFDGIVCIEALHHMPSYWDALAEIYRVLKPNRRAVFAEPGSRHSQSSEAIQVVRQYGYVEKDIVLTEIYDLARKVGFTRMALKPYIYPEFLTVDSREWQDYQAGRSQAPFANVADQARVIEASHSIFVLYKGGDRELDSVNPGTLRAALRILSIPGRVHLNEDLRVELEVVNTGDTLWLAAPREFGGYVTLGVKLCLPDGRVVDDTLGRTLLNQDVAPGELTRLTAVIRLPQVPPGKYVLRFDMVDEQVCWFEERGSEVVQHWLSIVR